MTGIANVGKVSEYQFHICNTANFFTSQKSQRVNLPISVVLVLTTCSVAEVNLETAGLNFFTGQMILLIVISLSKICDRDWSYKHHVICIT